MYKRQSELRAKLAAHKAREKDFAYHIHALRTQYHDILRRYKLMRNALKTFARETGLMRKGTVVKAATKKPAIKEKTTKKGGVGVVLMR